MDYELDNHYATVYSLSRYAYKMLETVTNYHNSINHVMLKYQ